MTRNLTKILGATAIIGAMAIGTAAPSMAQGVYFDGPGIGFGVGPRWHRDYYYDHGPRYRYEWRHHYYRDWD
jgi:hypothetical protein